jgi:hypothetical protein
MIPVVNTDVKMPKRMMHALNIFEAICAVRGIDQVTGEQVAEFLQEKYGPKMVAAFRSEYLFKNPAAGASPQ